MAAFLGVAQTSYTRTLWRALERAGSVDALAHYLQVPATRLRDWLEGAAPIPLEAYLQAFDVVESGRFGGRAKKKKTWH